MSVFSVYRATNYGVKWMNYWNVWRNEIATFLKMKLLLTSKTRFVKYERSLVFDACCRRYEHLGIRGDFALEVSSAD